MNQQTIPDKGLNWKREEPIAVPSPSREKRMAIRCSDWERIKRRISQIADPIPKLSVVYSILFGIAATSGLSILPIVVSQGLPSWVTPLYICIFLFSFLCGCVFVYVDRKFRSGRSSDIKDIKADMNDIEGMFETLISEPV
ncbi:MAG: hypothetical protein ACFFCW_49010 [Candidatus Hodarchaeota archaeon]